MNFILNMAWREMRASWQRLLLFFLCIAVGVGSIICLRSLVQRMKAAIMREARVMYASDVQAGANRAWKPETTAALDRYLNSPLVAAHTEVMETQTMARSISKPGVDSGGRPVMVILRGVQERFPLYGEVQLAGGARYTHSMLKDRGIIAPASLFSQLKLKPGDQVKLGSLTFTIRGVMEKMPGYGINLRPLPQVLVDYADATGAGLTGFGSFVWYRRYFNARDGKDQELLKQMARDLKPAPPDWLGSFRGLENFASRFVTAMRLQQQQVTYRSDLMADETVIAGKFWDPKPSAEAEVAVRDNFAENYKLAIGDALVFDLAGRRIEAKVVAVRRINWGFSVGQGYARFNVYFRPGPLDDAPQTFFGTAKGPPPGESRARLQRELVEQFPNVSVIDFYDQAEFMQSKLRDASLAVNFLGGFVFLCGVLILTGSVAMTKFHRLYEAAILKTLGAKKKLIVYITVIEYGVLGLLAGLIGSSSALLLTWAISRYAMKITWRFAPTINLISVAVTLLLVVVVGVLSSLDVIRKKPLSILRTE